MRHFIKTYSIASLAAAAVGLSGCADASSANPSPETIVLSSDAPQWDIQSDASHIRFSALQEGEAFTGAFTEFSGLIRFDPAAPETGVVDITIPLGSVDAGSKDRNSTLPGKVWFSAKAFPEAKFTSDNLSKTETGYVAKGTLTLKGVSLPFNLPFALTLDGGQAVMTGQVDMDRTSWDVGSDPWNTDEWVSRNVSLDIQVTAKRLD